MARTAFIITLFTLLIYGWPGCDGDRSSDPSLKSINNLPVPPAFQSRWGREEELALPVQNQRPVHMHRNPDVCRRLVSYAKHYNTDGQRPRLSEDDSTRDYVSKLLGTQNCSLGFSDAISAIHVLRSQDHAEVVGMADRGEEGNMRTVKVYRLRFAQRMTRDSLQFSQLKLVLPVVIAPKNGHCPQQRTKYKVVLLDGETVVSRFVEGFKMCNNSSSTPSHGNETITAVVDATGIMSQVFLSWSDLDESVHLPRNNQLVSLSLKLVYHGGMFAEIPPSARASLVLVQASEPVGCQNVLETKTSARSTTVAPSLPPFLRNICQNICTRHRYDIDMQQYVTSRYSDLNIHASLGSVDVGACRGGCQARPMRSCGFERYTKHSFVMTALQLRSNELARKLPNMLCAVDIMRLKSILLPYSYENNATEYSDCGIVSIKQARIPAGDDSCRCV